MVLSLTGFWYLLDNHIIALSITDRQDRWRCRQGSYHQDIPVRKGTWLEGARLKYRQVILFIYYWSQEMTSVSFCETQIEIGQNSSINWNNFLREICAMKLIENSIKLSGQTLQLRLTKVFN